MTTVGSFLGPIQDLVHNLLDHEFDLAPEAGELEDSDSLQAHQSPQDLIRVGDDVGASCLVSHNSSVKHLRRVLGDPRRPGTPR